MAPASDRRVLIIEARFYEELADEMASGAVACLDEAGIGYDRIAVPGALEIPGALGLAVEAGLFGSSGSRPLYDGCVALGCVIRGETTHYETVATESTRWLMQLATAHHIPLGNGILTVENDEQAKARARGGKSNKGGGAAIACIRLMDLKLQFRDQD